MIKKYRTIPVEKIAQLEAEVKKGGV